MANTPTLSLRVPPELHDLVRSVVGRLKANAGFQDDLRKLLAGTAAAVAPPAALAALTARVEALEARLAAPPTSPPAESDTPRDSTSTPARKAATEPPMAELSRRARAVNPEGTEPTTAAPNPAEPELFPGFDPHGDAPASAESAAAGGEQQPQATTSPDTPPASPASKPKRHNLTPEQKAEVVRLYDAGKRVFEIVAATGISQPSVSRIIAASKKEAAQ